jgi:hypothetical protein
VPRNVTEGAKQLSEWCRWSTAVETAAIAAVGVLLKTEAGQQTPYAVRICCAVAVICLGVSIALNAFMLGSLPETVQHAEESENIWDREVDFILFELRYWFVANTKLVVFVIGIAALVTAVVWTAVNPPTVKPKRDNEELVGALAGERKGGRESFLTPCPGPLKTAPDPLFFPRSLLPVICT